LPARIGSPRQKRGNRPNDQNNVVGLRKDWCSLPNKARPRAEVGETTGIKVQHPCATTLLLAVLHRAATRKTIDVLYRKRL
ncbi:hypothetical protein A2U01_0063558, partial [Trifolium medium]|nr:hypothetical protein [Trifolium medium]